MEDIIQLACVSALVIVVVFIVKFIFPLAEAALSFLNFFLEHMTSIFEAIG